MNTELLKRKSNFSESPDSKRSKQIPWINWNEAEQSYHKAQSIAQFVNAWKSNELYLDDPSGTSYHLNFEFPMKSVEKIYLTIDSCDGADGETPLVDLRFEGRTVKVRWIETASEARFSKAWEITQSALKLFNITDTEVSDYYWYENQYPEQLIHSLRGKTRFEAVGLIPTEEVKQAQEFLRSFTLDDVKGILEGFTASISALTKLGRKYSMGPKATLSELVCTINESELKTLCKECLTPWKPDWRKKNSPLLNAYLAALQLLSRPNVYRSVEKIAEVGALFAERSLASDFRARLDEFTKVTRIGLFYSETVTLVVKVAQEKIFHSTALNEILLRDDPQKKNPYHTFVTVDETIGDSVTNILKLTYSPEGRCAELGWIQRGDAMTGNQVFDFFDWIDKYLQPETTYLYDDAKVCINNEENVPCEVSLRCLNAMVSHDDKAASWYEKKGFSLLSVPEKSPFLRRGLGTSYVYKPGSYEISRQFIRNTKASFLIETTLKNHPEEQEALLEIGKKHLQKGEFTLHELFAAIHEADRKSPDLLRLYSICFKDFRENEISKRKFPEAYKKYREYIDHFSLFSLLPIYVRNKIGNN